MYMTAGLEGQRQWREGILVGFPSASPSPHPGPGSDIKPEQQVGGEEQALDQRTDSWFTANCTLAKRPVSNLHSLVCRAEAWAT